MSEERTKDPAAVALGKKRWKGIEVEERTEITRAAVNSRWENATAKDRASVGKKLAAARAAAKKKRANKPTTTADK